VEGVKVFRAQGAEALADEWMVAFGPEATDETLAQFCKQSGPCKYMGHPDKGGVPFVVVQGSEEALGSKLATHGTAGKSGILYVEQDAEAVDTGRLEETLLRKAPATPWNIREIGSPTTRSAGKGVNVYVLDSGVRVTHQAFGGRAIPFYDANVVPPQVCNSADVECAKDERGHGSHVAGIVGAEFYGVAPASTIFAMQRGKALSDGYASMDWLVQNRKRPAVLTLSWGGLLNSEVAKAAVDAAVAAGMVAVAGAGNNAVDACEFTFAFIPSVISVASMDPFFKRSPFSNYGECVDIFAPGSMITSLSHESDDGTDKRSGTSMAGPHVAGAAALLLEANPEMTSSEILAQLKSVAEEGRLSDVRGPTNLFLQLNKL